MSRSTNYKKVKDAKGIYQHKTNKRFMAEKRINGKLFSSSFISLFEAKKWHKQFDGNTEKFEAAKVASDCATLKEVWLALKEHHFPILASSTKQIWERRFSLWVEYEDLPMDLITPSKITSWVVKWVEHFSTEDYQSSGRGVAGRCNLNNELNMFVTIFNWYKQSEFFEKEAVMLTCPVKPKHRKMGFIKTVPDKKKQIELHHAFLFFDFLRPLYQDLAKMQFFTAGRVGEVAGLQWSNIDLKNRRLLIKKTCVWDMSSKTFLELKPFPKNKETRAVFITDEILQILKRRQAFKIPGNDFVFHVEGEPLNYCTIQINYRAAQRKSGVPYTGTHILRHGMAKLARQVGGGLDAVLAMTGHKDLKLADHYSKCTEDDQKHTSEKIMAHIRREIKKSGEDKHSFENVLKLKRFKTA